MKSWDITDWMVVFLSIIVVLLIAYLIAYLPPAVSAQKICNEHGWSEGIVEYNFDQYCRRIVNQTEYVCPLENVLSNSCVFDYKDGN